VQAFPQLGRRGAADRRLGTLEPLDQQVDRAVAQLAHGLRIERERGAVLRPALHGACILPEGGRFY
jgi:predicted amino acid dehydrogenase